MTVLRVDSAEASYLAGEFPESGMGFQVFEGGFAPAHPRFFLALNSEYFISFASLSELRRDLAAISEWGIEALADRAELIPLRSRPSDIASVIGWKLAGSQLDPTREWNPALTAMIGRQEIIATEVVTEPRMYFRFSPFPNDRRVLQDGSFLPGTYATTYNDMKMVPSAFAAVGRYALPSTLPAQYVFAILTDESPVYVGTATPNFGQAGGGVEVLFPNGARAMHGAPHRVARD